MGKCVIFCAGGFHSLVQPLGKSDYIIAADGGLAHVQALGIQPDCILGDFDSLGYVPEGAEVYPVEKDDTDAMLAVKRGLAKGFREFVIYGGLDGPRVDHTVANFQTLRYLACRGCFGVLVGLESCAGVIQNDTLSFSGTPEGGVSVFCMGENARGVTLRGLYYPLVQGTLTGDFPLGVSNHFTGKPASISVEKGTLLVIWQRQAGMPGKGVN